MFITKKHLSRRTVLKGMGVDRGAAVPRRDGAGAARARGAGRVGAEESGCVAIEMVHGAAGSTAFGVKKNLWAPADGRPRLRPVADAA